MYSYGTPHMAKQKQDDLLELTYSSYVRTHNVTLKTCQRRWIIGRSGERRSGISVLAARYDDDDYLSKGYTQCDQILAYNAKQKVISLYIFFILFLMSVFVSDDSAFDQHHIYRLPSGLGQYRHLWLSNQTLEVDIDYLGNLYVSRFLCSMAYKPSGFI